MATLNLSRHRARARTTITVGLIGTGTAWTPGTPGTPVFTLTGGTGASITSQTVNTATTATLTINTGTALGNLTITDPSTNATQLLTIERATHNRIVPLPWRRGYYQ